MTEIDRSTNLLPPTPALIPEVDPNDGVGDIAHTQLSEADRMRLGYFYAGLTVYRAEGMAILAMQKTNIPTNYEDAVQEAALTVFKMSAEGALPPDDIRLRGLLKVITYRRGIDLLRSYYRLVRDTDYDYLIDHDIPDDPPIEEPPMPPNLYRAVRRQLRNMLPDKPASYRKVFAARLRYPNASSEEIGKKTDMTAGAVRVAEHRIHGIFSELRDQGKLDRLLGILYKKDDSR